MSNVVEQGWLRAAYSRRRLFDWGSHELPIAVSKQHFGAFAKTMVSTSKILNSPSGICGHKTFRTLTSLPA